jgi:hypothetical protein
VDIATLAERARSEAIANSSLIQTYSLIGAWCQRER